MSSSYAHDTSRSETPFGTLLRPVTAIGFWAAVGLPFIYVPILLAGLETTNARIAVAILIAVHVISLVVGRQYHRE